LSAHTYGRTTLRQRCLHDHRGTFGRDTSPRSAACRGVPPTGRQRSTPTPSSRSVSPQRDRV